MLQTAEAVAQSYSSKHLFWKTFQTSLSESVFNEVPGYDSKAQSKFFTEHLCTPSSETAQININFVQYGLKQIKRKA